MMITKNGVSLRQRKNITKTCNLCYKNITQYTSFTSLFGCVWTGTLTHTCVSGLCKQSDPLPSLYGIERNSKRNFVRYRRLARN